MPTFIKTGFWEKSAKGFKGWLNLEDVLRGSEISNASYDTDIINNVNVDVTAQEVVFQFQNRVISDGGSFEGQNYMESIIDRFINNNR